MVRFIIQLIDGSNIQTPLFTFHYGQIYYKRKSRSRRRTLKIYIPLWLDLLFRFILKLELKMKNLHSTMVRFIIPIRSSRKFIKSNLHSTMVRFIIFIPIQKKKRRANLHSTMVRFIMRVQKSNAGLTFRFTFHYGQIYYYDCKQQSSYEL